MFRKRSAAYVAGAIVLAVVVAGTWLVSTRATCHAQPEVAAWGEEMLGIVRDGQFYPVGVEGELVLPQRLTGIRMQEAIAPEAGELNLSRYEGRAIMIEGHGGGGWIYSAQVVDEAGPILTAVVKEVFDDED